MPKLPAPSPTPAAKPTGSGSTLSHIDATFAFAILPSRKKCAPVPTAAEVAKPSSSGVNKCAEP